MSEPLTRRDLLKGLALGALALGAGAAGCNPVVSGILGTPRPSADPPWPPPAPSPSPPPAATGAAGPTGTAGVAAISGPFVDGYRHDPFLLVALDPRERYWGDETGATLEPTGPVDDEGIPVRIRDGIPYRHPVDLLNLALPLVETWRATGDRRYLDRAAVLGEALMEVADESEDAPWFPYEFPFRLHGLRDEELQPPWYSGMAQGMAVALHVRLADARGDRRWLETAGRAMGSLVRPPRPGLPWVSRVDQDGHLWIEEYPGDRPDRTLNGYIFALFGVYDYVMVTGDPDARHLLEGGLTTIRNLIPKFRVPGEMSRYCLAHGVQNEKYHGIHIQQLRMLHRMTGEPVFLEYSQLLAADA